MLFTSCCWFIVASWWCTFLIFFCHSRVSHICRVSVAFWWIVWSIIFMKLAILQLIMLYFDRWNFFVGLLFKFFSFSLLFSFNSVAILWIQVELNDPPVYLDVSTWLKFILRYNSEQSTFLNYHFWTHKAYHNVLQLNASDFTPYPSVIYSSYINISGKLVIIWWFSQNIESCTLWQQMLVVIDECHHISVSTFHLL